MDEIKSDLCKLNFKHNQYENDCEDNDKNSNYNDEDNYKMKKLKIQKYKKPRAKEK